MKKRYILWLTMISLIHAFNWYFVMCFCSVFIMSNYSWIIGGIISFVIDIFILKVVVIFISAVMRSIAIKTKSNVASNVINT